MHILIAPNAFKNSLDATGVAEAIAEGLRDSGLKCTTTNFPIADGGDGTGALLISHLAGDRVETQVHDPLGKTISSSFGWIEKTKTAIIEMADASGLRLLKKTEYNPMQGSSYGTGELIKAALDRQPNEIILCIGGSATVDGGTGIWRAMGAKFLDADKKELDGSPRSLLSMESIDDSQVDPRIHKAKMTILCDVDNRLLGPQGAPAVFGPQKGASPDDVQLLEQFLGRLRDIVFKQTGNDIGQLKHGGAAGGVAAGLHGFCNASLVNGIDHFLFVTDFSRILEKSDLVITGEGSLDEQTLHGKGPFGVAKKAKEFSKPVIGLAGTVTDDNELQEYFDRLISINEEKVDLQIAIKNTHKNLVRTSCKLGMELGRSGS